MYTSTKSIKEKKEIMFVFKMAGTEDWSQTSLEITKKCRDKCNEYFKGVK